MSKAPVIAETTDTPVVLSSKVAKQIDAIRPTFIAYAHDFGGIVARRADIAPRFMKACGAWQTEAGGTFVDFVRVLDPDVPLKREEYRAHTSYQAADYLRRLIGRLSQEAKEPVAPEDRPATPLEACASLLSVVLPLVGDADVLWKAFASELNWSDSQIQRLAKMVVDATPVLRAPKHLDKPVLRAA